MAHDGGGGSVKLEDGDRGIFQDHGVAPKTTYTGTDGNVQFEDAVDDFNGESSLLEQLITALADHNGVTELEIGRILFQIGAITDLTPGNSVTGIASVQIGDDRLEVYDGLMRVGDVLAMGAEKDVVLARDGNDFVFGGGGDDVMMGGDGNDFLSGDAGADTIFGGTGMNTASYLLSDAAVGVDLNREVQIGGHAAGDRLRDIGNLVGSHHGDTLTGNDLGNVINSGAGDDTVHGGGGADDIDAGSGADTVYGGSGNDLIRGRMGDDTVFGGEGADTIVLGDGADWVAAGDGGDNDLLTLGQNFSASPEFFSRDTWQDTVRAAATFGENGTDGVFSYNDGFARTNEPADLIDLSDAFDFADGPAVTDQLMAAFHVVDTGGAAEIRDRGVDLLLAEDDNTWFVVRENPSETHPDGRPETVRVEVDSSQFVWDLRLNQPAEWQTLSDWLDGL